MATQEEIFAKIQETLVDALGVDDDDVTADARLGADLGAESIDFLDIVFRLEKGFDIQIPKGDLFPENILSDPEFVSDGQVTEKGLEELERRLPYADLTNFRDDPQVDGVPDLFTVDLMCKYIDSKVNGVAA